MDIYDVIIIGGGPAGLTAGLYLGRAKRRTLLLEKESPGGQLMNIEKVDNYPGFASGVQGAELGSQMLSQAVNHGLLLKLAEVRRIELHEKYKLVQATDAECVTKAIIIAGGARPRRLGVPGEERLRGGGVIYCAVCDGGQFVDRVVAVAGGGDGGITEALYLTKLASKVIIIELLPALTATTVLQERAFANSKIKVRCGTKIEAIIGDNQVRAVDLVDVETGQRSTLEVDGVLVHVGLDPNTEYLQGTVPLDGEGQIVVNEVMETPIPGIFAAGDVRKGSPRQIITAAGDGATAALSAERFLSAN